MSLKEIWLTSISTVGLIAVSGLAAANKNPGIAVASAAAAATSSALLGMQIFLMVNPQDLHKETSENEAVLSSPPKLN